MPITKIKPTNISNTGVYGISTGTDITQNNNITAVFSLANGTAGVANTDYTGITITSGSYGNASYVPVVNVAANGRVTGISTTPVSGGSSNNWYSSVGYFINSNTVTANITVTTANNAMSIGPTTINSGVTTVLQTGSRWIIL
jgi:hypothetical protein